VVGQEEKAIVGRDVFPARCETARLGREIQQLDGDRRCPEKLVVVAEEDSIGPLFLKLGRQRNSDRIRPLLG
jgi:hypothetical protein